MNITNTKIYKLDSGNTLALASITLDNEFVVSRDLITYSLVLLGLSFKIDSVSTTENGRQSLKKLKDEIIKCFNEED